MGPQITLFGWMPSSLKIALATEGMPVTLLRILAGCVAPCLLLAAVVGGSPPAKQKPRRARTDNYGDPLPPGALARLGTVRLRHPGTIIAVTYSPDGKLLASGGWDKVVRLWDSKTGKQVRTLSGLRGTAVRSLSFSPDGKILAAGVWDDVVRIWDVASGRQVRQLGKKTEDLCWLAFSPDGKTLAVSSHDTVRLWETAGWRERKPLQAKGGRVQAVAFSADGKYLLGGEVGGVSSWNLAAGGVRVFHLGKGTYCAAISRNGDKVAASGSRGGGVVLWDGHTGKELQRFHGPPRRRREGGATAVQFSPDGKTLAASGWDGFVLIWDVRSGKLLHQFGRGEADFWHVAFAPGGKVLACAAERAVRLWDTATGKELLLPGAPCRAIESVTFTPDGKHIAWGEGNLVRFTDVVSLKEVRRFQSDQETVSRIVFAPDGKTFATEDGGRTVRLWETATGRSFRAWVNALIVKSDVGGEAREPLRVTPDLKRIIIWHTPEYDWSEGGITEEDLGVAVKEAGTGKLVLNFRRAEGGFGVVDVSPAGNLLALAARGRISNGSELASRLLTDGQTILLHDATTGKELCRLKGPRAVVKRVRFSPDGRALLAACENGDLCVWELASARERLRLNPHAGKSFGMTCSADGQLVATWAGEGPVCLWDLATGQKLKALDGHRGGVCQAAFSPDGSLLATAGKDATGLLWDLSGLRGKTRPRPIHLAAKDLDRLTVELGSPDAAVAWRAILKLEAAGRQALPYLEQRLRAKRPNAEEIAKLIGDLGSSKFAVREKAERELAEIIDFAAPALRRVLKNGPTLEVRRRVERLLAQRSGGLWRGRSLHVVRAIEALERIGTAEAKQALKELAASKPEDRLSREAMAALGRLARK
jgi:WD40 repeat protein